MKKQVKGKVVLITGGALGMGKEVAKLFAQDEARIVLWDVRKDELDKAAKELRGLGAEVYTYICDVTDWKMVNMMADRVRKEVGSVDILNNNAAVVFGGDFLDVPEEKLFKNIDVNVNGVMWCTKAFLPDMVKRNDGHIIMMASAGGYVPIPGAAAYAASKWAVIGLSDSIRLELQKKGIKGVKLTVVCPGYVQTGMFEGSKVPFITRWLTPEEMGQKIYRGYLKDKLFVRAPFLINLLIPLLGLIPTRGIDWLAGSLGLNETMDMLKGREDTWNTLKSKPKSTSKSTSKSPSRSTSKSKSKSPSKSTSKR